MRRRTILLTALSLLLLVTVPVLAPYNLQLTVVINEICWAGTAWDHTAEWIELFNTTDSPVDLEGWQLISSDGAPHIHLQGVLLPHTDADATSGYFLLERGSDESVPGIDADIVYQGALTNSGEALALIDSGKRMNPITGRLVLRPCAATPLGRFGGHRRGRILSTMPFQSRR